MQTSIEITTARLLQRYPFEDRVIAEQSVCIFRRPNCPTEDLVSGRAQDQGVSKRGGIYLEQVMDSLEGAGEI